MNEPDVVVPVDVREMTRIILGNNEIHIIHEISIGTIIISVLLSLILITMLIKLVIRR